MSSSPLIDLSSAGILCIDDDPVMRAVVRAALQNRGCRDIVQTKGGQEALDICAGRGFDLVICDYQMAPMNGLEFLKTLGQSGLASGWPVIMLSAETNPDTIAEAQELGIHAWVSKPISAIKLIERVGSALGLRSPSSSGSVDASTRESMERQHAHMMSGIAALEEVMGSFPFRVRERVSLVRSVLRALETVSEPANTLGYDLVVTLAGRGIALMRAAEQFPAGAARCHADLGRVILSLTMAMKRVAHNRLNGDGGEAGLKLLQKVDELLTPIRASLKLESAATAVSGVAN
jgi:CheY-like chemotaxis protein